MHFIAALCLVLCLSVVPSSRGLLAEPRLTARHYAEPLRAGAMITTPHHASRVPALAMQIAPTIKSPRIAIEYCSRCNWMLRSAWTAQELLTTFNGTIGEVALIPNHRGRGTFEVSLLTSAGEIMLFSRQEQGRFPENKELKNLVRDAVDPGRDLGHSEEIVVPVRRGTGTTAFERLVAIFKGDPVR
mmetsp:Transcript_11729/g.23890  ORF Transcript_11729/g.23890 Transcript_11729/m.23890 type:complete len:187 (+) Transcript_11729:29-589(+)